MAKLKSRSQPTYNVVVELSRALRVNPQWAKVICKQERSKIYPQQCERQINSFKQQIRHIIAPKSVFKLMNTVLSVSQDCIEWKLSFLLDCISFSIIVALTDV